MQNAIALAAEHILSVAAEKNPISEHDYPLLKQKFVDQLMETIGAAALSQIPEDKHLELLQKLSAGSETDLTTLFAEYIPEIETFMQEEIRKYTDEIIENFTE